MDDISEKERLYPSNIRVVLYNEKDVKQEPEQTETNETNEKQKQSTRFLYFSVITANLTMIACGCTLTWSSPAIPKLKSTDPEINPLKYVITPLQESLVASLPSLGALIGPIFSIRYADKYGRRKTMIAVILLKIISFILLAFIPNIYLYYVTRILLGTGASIIFSLLPMYIGEVCENHNRGKLGCLIPFFGTTGNLYTLVVGPVLPLKYFTFLCTVPLAYVLICFIFFIPESPMHLANAGKREDAIKSLMMYRSIDRKTAQNELVEITNTIEDTKNIKISNFFESPVLRKTLLICAVLGFLQHLSGIAVVMAFTQSIFDSTESGISSSLSMILVGVIQMIAVIAASLVVEKLGRRLLLLVSCTVCCIALVSLSIYFYLKDANSAYITNIPWLPVISVMVYCVSYNFGLSPGPFILVSEMFSPKVRSFGASATAFCMFLTSFTLVSIFPFMVIYLGTGSCFILYGTFCILAIVFIYFKVPETKGKSLIEIQRILNSSYR